MLVGVDASRAVRPLRTGTENYSLHLIRALVEAGGRHRYRLYVDRATPKGFLPHGTSVEPCLIRTPYLWTHAGLSFELARRSPEVLFVPAHVLPVYRPCPSVVTIHDLGYLRYPAAHRPLARLYLRLGTRFSARVATRIIAVSEATKSDLVAQLGVDPSRVVVIPEAPGSEFVPLVDRTVGEKAARQHGIEPPYLLALGSVHPRKNLGRLVEAFGRARTRAGFPHRLALVGNLGYRAGEVREEIERHGLAGAVILTGYLPPAELPLVVGAADALVFPSLFEGFGLPALEAMACAVPVLAANVAALPEVVGDAGLLFDPLDVEAMAQAIARGLGDPALRLRLSRQGLLRAAAFTWERAARATLRVLEEAALA